METAINYQLECSDRLRFRTIMENEWIATSAGASRHYHKWLFKMFQASQIANVLNNFCNLNYNKMNG